MEEIEYVCCLKRKGENNKKYKFINLNGKDEVTIGRSPDVSVCILSTMISRCHAVLKKKDAGWTILDNKSLNGVYVNGKKIEPMKSQELVNGDEVQLGVATNGNHSAEYIYNYFTNLKVKRPRKDPPIDETDSSVVQKYPLKRIRLDDNEGKSSDTNCHAGKTKTGNSDEEVTFKNAGKMKKPEWSPFEDYKEKLTEKEKEAEKRLEEYERKLQEMQDQLRAKEEEQEVMKSALEEEKKRHEDQAKEMRDILMQKEEEMAEQRRKKQEDEKRLREELENQLLAKEAQMLEQLQNQKSAVIEEKRKVEEQLKEAMDQALEEKDKKLEEELTRQKEKLESIISKKELEQKMLEGQLSETKAEKDKQNQEMLHARQDILSNFSDLMEMELQCSICSELFIQATSLNCSHGFCNYCIMEWMKIKKECPICRTPITSHMRSIVLDSYIDKMVEYLSDDLKQRRKELVQTRKDEQKKQDEQKAVTSVNTRGRGQGRVRGGRVRGGRVRGGRGGRRNATNTARPPPTAAAVHENPNTDVPIDPIVIEIDDNETSDPMEVSSEDDVDGIGDDSDDSIRDSDDEDEFFSDMRSDSDDDDFVRGEGGAYYGGYGRCYRCGMRGHWANGCPL